MNNQTTYRAFLAIVPQKSARDEIREIKRKFKKQERNFRSVPLDQVHITLQFLGNSVNIETIQSVMETCKNIANNTMSFQICLNKVRFGFPGQNIARVLYMDVEKNPDLSRLVKEIHQSLKFIDSYEINKKKDHAKLINHLTLARVKGDVSRSFTREVNSLIDDIDFVPIEFVVESLHLIKSVVKNNSTQYLPLAEFRLKN